MKSTHAVLGIVFLLLLACSLIPDGLQKETEENKLDLQSTEFALEPLTNFLH